jgi:DNA-directed RNA polymerase specialized sigma subunit
MVKKPGDWKWSSYRATAGLEKAERWLETDWILGQFARTEKQAQESYKSFVADGMGKKESPWEELSSQVYLGKEEFLDKVHEVGRKHRPMDVPKYQKQVVKKDPNKVLKRIGEVYGEKPEEILKSGKRRREAREAAIYWLKKESGLSLKEIGERMGVGFSAVGNQWARIKAKMAKDKAFGKRLLKCKM